MALKIQLRRDIAANWTANNPLLLNGEIGIETDTLKFKVGNGSQRWNAIEFYALKPGSPNGVATLDSSGKVPLSQIPAFNSIQDLESAITSAFNSKTTTNIAEGTNLYFTPARAIAAGQTAFDPIGSANQAVVTAATNTATKINDLINSAPGTLNTLSELAAALGNSPDTITNLTASVGLKAPLASPALTGVPTAPTAAINTNTTQIATTAYAKAAADAAQTAAATDATTKANSAITTAATDATTKANAAQAAAIAAAAADATTKANSAQATAITAALADANAKADAAKLAAIAAAAADATNRVFTAQMAAQDYADNGDIETDSILRAHMNNTISTSINALTTSDIEEGSNKYFTDQRAKAAVALDIANAIAAIPGGGSSLASTTDLAEGTNLYFTNARAVTATNAARTNVLLSALSAVDDLRTELHADLLNYIPVSEINALSGIAGLDASGKVSETTIPSTIARTSDITSAIAGIVNTAPASFDTLKEIADYIASDQTGASTLTTLVGTKLSSTTAATTYAPIASPTFTGTVTIPAGASISGFATSINLTAALNEAKAYTDTARNGLNNSLGDYQPESEKNQTNGYAGLDSSGKILVSAVPVISNSMLQNSAITINGSSISLGGSVNTGYTNGISGSNVNKITYGASATPPASGNVAGDIYIQY
jgi:hypothetical protein